jgi:alpha-beta hydrolase superfamily lysophospholipase
MAIDMQSTEHTFRTWDGVELFYRAWLPAGGASRALLLFHRGHEHSARWQETVDALALEDTAVFAWDQRGHGQSPGERGSAENLAAVIKDAEWLARHVAREHKVALEDTAVLAHSVGAVIASAWVHDYAPPLRAMVLAAPAFRVKLYVPLAVPMLRLRQKLFGHGFVKSYVKAHMLTRDTEQAAAYRADPAIFRQIAVNILLDLHDTSTRLMADAGAITLPTLMLGAGRDWVVRLDAQWRFYRNLSSTVKQMEVFADAGHALFHDVDRVKVVERARTFLTECFERPSPRPLLRDADRGGFTRTEYDWLRTPPSLRWRVIQGVMKSIGKTSNGIRLGWREGFDSGVMLDYVYRNRPSGNFGIGRLLDRSYLKSVGWQGIRVRRLHLQALLREAIEQTTAEGRPVHIVDIAAGAGRYVLETLHSMNIAGATALLRDYKQANLDAARLLVSELGLRGVEVEWGDAFDESSLAGLRPKPTIAIVSGLYELFPDNAPVIASLRGLAQAMQPGARLIYTCQPWHPQVEFIARVLTNREGQPWVMRRRTQEEMDALVRKAGFVKQRQEIDQWGIFSACTARRA